MDSLIVSHVANESGNFIPKFIHTEADFTTFVNDFLPEHSLFPVRTAVETKYPAQGPPYNGDPRARVAALIRDASFTCNTRLLYEAYKNRSIGLYMMQYDFLETENLALHSYDLLPTFWNGEMDTAALFEKFIPHISPVLAKFIAFIFNKSGYAPSYQSYFASHALSGNPNTARSGRTVPWPNATDNGDKITNVMETGYSFPFDFFSGKTTDRVNTGESCNFWTNLAFWITNLTETEMEMGVLGQHGKAQPAWDRMAGETQQVPLLEL